MSMSARIEPEQGHEWITSDAQILNRMVAEGNTLTLMMPYGETFEAQVENMNLSAAQSFCEHARGAYIEWQTSKKAASHARHAELASRPPAGREADEESVEFSKSGLAIDPLDSEAIAAHCATLGDRLGKLQAEARNIDKELTKYYRILEVLNELDAPKTTSKTAVYVSPDENGGKTERVDSSACEQEDVPSGQEEAGEYVAPPIEEQLSDVGGDV
jgi:hypothetical protein